MRVKRGVVRHRKHKKVFAATKGFRGMRKNVFRRAKEALLKAGNNAFRDRRVKKRDFRHSWISTINIACRQNGIKYSEFIHGLSKIQINLDRKVLADLAKNNQLAFADLIKKVKTAL